MATPKPTSGEIRNAITELTDLMPREGQQYATLPNGMSVPVYTNDVLIQRRRNALQLAIQVLKYYEEHGE